MEQKKKPQTTPFEGPYKKTVSAIPGKYGKSYSTVRHLARLGMKKAMQKSVKEETELKHRVSVTVSDPQHTMASMRKEKMEKKIRVSAKSESDAVELAKDHYKRQGYKIHDANHVGIVEETEQVDEISNELLQRYKQKAGAQVDNPETPSSVKYKRGKGHLLATVKQMKSGKPLPPIQKEEAEMNEAVSVKKANYSWGKMVTVHHGAETSYPLHPEHQKAIKRLRNGDKTSFKDETGRNVHVHREGDKVHLMSKEGNYKPTTVDYKHFEEGNMSLFKQFRAKLEEKTLTPAEKKKREEVAKAIERENPNMPMGMKMAIATKTAKRVAEEMDDEGNMARGQLMQLISQASMLAKMMDDFKQLDGWVQSKLTKAADYLDSVHDYLMHNKQDVDKMEEEFDLEETKSAPKGFHFTKDGKLKRGDADRDGPGGLMLRSDPLDKQRNKVPPVSEDQHLCAKHVRSSLLGDGVVLEAQHADPDAEGNIEWYMVEFKDGIHKVFTEDLEIMIAEYHGNHKKKKRMTNG